VAKGSCSFAPLSRKNFGIVLNVAYAATWFKLKKMLFIKHTYWDFSYQLYGSYGDCAFFQSFCHSHYPFHTVENQSLNLRLVQDERPSHIPVLALVTSWQ
jgi:hypothetical protein